ncbi:MAG TPA: protein phosphatase 2C domain-containing protein [Nannocystaceae bacterium]|nr:protein phosphatase 2C domain-containing protein [Nannocystaceae bacterium]
MRTRSHGATDTGKVRAHNEDAHRGDDRLGLYVVCDGVGGRARGEVAAELTVESISGWVARELPALRALPQSDARAGRLGAMLWQAIQHACYMVHSMGRFDPEHKGMSTTVSALLVLDGLGVVGQVGDSRIYLARAGEVRQITDDHTVVAERLRRGEITAAEARASKMRNLITRAVGMKDHVQPDIRTVELRAGDRVLLCSDGLHEYLDDAADLAALFRLPLAEAARRAIIHANDRGGKDNITALFVECLAD